MIRNLGWRRATNAVDCVPGLLRMNSSILFHRLQYTHQPSEPSMEALGELKAKTRGLRKSLMATAVLVDASVATCNEWLSVITDYVGPHLNHISGKFLDHQVRNTRFFSNLRSPTTRTWAYSFEWLSSRMDHHPRARVPFFASDTSASLKLSGGIVWKFHSSLD